MLFDYKFNMKTTHTYCIDVDVMQKFNQKYGKAKNQLLENFMRQTLNELSKLTKCPECNAEYSEKLNYCPACSTNEIKQEQEREKQDALRSERIKQHELTKENLQNRINELSISGKELMQQFQIIDGFAEKEILMKKMDSVREQIKELENQLEGN